MHEVRLPKFGMSTVEVDVIKVLIAPGQQVAVGDPLLDVETDKAMLTMESEVAGTVTEICVVEGETYEVGDLVCRLDPG